MGSLAEKLAAMPKEKREYTLVTMAEHLVRAQNYNQLYKLLLSDREWLDAKYEAYASDISYATDVDIAIKNFHINSDVIDDKTLCQLLTARCVTNERIDVYKAADLELIAMENVDRAIAYALQPDSFGEKSSFDKLLYVYRHLERTNGSRKQEIYAQLRKNLSMIEKPEDRISGHLDLLELRSDDTEIRIEIDELLFQLDRSSDEFVSILIRYTAICADQANINVLINDAVQFKTVTSSQPSNANILQIAQRLMMWHKDAKRCLDFLETLLTRDAFWYLCKLIVRKLVTTTSDTLSLLTQFKQKVPSQDRVWKEIVLDACVGDLSLAVSKLDQLQDKRQKLELLSAIALANAETDLTISQITHMHIKELIEDKKLYISNENIVSFVNSSSSETALLLLEHTLEKSVKPDRDQLIEDYANHIQLHGQQVINEKFIDFLLHMRIGVRFGFRENCRLLMTELLQQRHYELAQVVHRRIIELVKESQQEENHNTSYGLTPMIQLGQMIYRHDRSCGRYILKEIEQDVVRQGDEFFLEYLRLARSYAYLEEIHAEERVLDLALAALRVGTILPGAYPQLAQYLYSRGYLDKANKVFRVLRETADTVLANQWVKMPWTKADALIYLTEAFLLCGFNELAVTTYNEAKEFILEAELDEVYLQQLDAKFEKVQQSVTSQDEKISKQNLNTSLEDSPLEQLVSQTQNIKIYAWLGIFATHTPNSLKQNSQELVETVGQMFRIAGWFHSRWQRTYQGFTELSRSNLD